MLIENDLRKAGIVLKRKPGTSTVGDGVGTNDDMKAATVALSLFGKKNDDLPEKATLKFASKWKRVGLASRASEILRDLEVLKEMGDAPAAAAD